MKNALILLLFFSTACLGQYPIKSHKDLPLIDDAKKPAVAYGEELLKRLITPPDTVNNEWEKYAIYYLSDDEYGFSATDCHWLEISKPHYYYIDSLSYNPRGYGLDVNLGEHLFQAARAGKIPFLSYDTKHKVKSEEVINIFRATEEDDFIDHLEVHLPDTIIQRKVDILSLMEFNKYVVIEKTVRTKKFQIQSKILAICPIMTTSDDKGNYVGRKACGWFILPE